MPKIVLHECRVALNYSYSRTFLCNTCKGRAAAMHNSPRSPPSRKQPHQSRGSLVLVPSSFVIKEDPSPPPSKFFGLGFSSSQARPTSYMQMV